MNTKIDENDIVKIDSGFTCMPKGVKLVYKDHEGLFVICSKGKHYLCGQHGVDDLIGITKV